LTGATRSDDEGDGDLDGDGVCLREILGDAAFSFFTFFGLFFLSLSLSLVLSFSLPREGDLDF